jgi:hypothetical protein
MDARIFIWLACLLMIAGVFGAWEVYTAVGSASGNALGQWQGNLAFVGVILLLFSGVISYNLLNIQWFEFHNPTLGVLVGGLGGVFGLVASLAYWAGLEGSSPGWGLYLTLLAGLFAILASFGMVRQESPSIPRGLGR